MRFFLFLFVFLNYMVLGAPLSAQGPKGLVGYTFKASYMDRYLFRGHSFNDDSTFVGQFGVGAGQWSYNLLYAEPVDQIGTIRDEFSHTIGFTTLTPTRVTTMGYQFYDYSGLQPNTQEIFFRVSHSSGWHPTYGMAFDFDTYRGYYADFSLMRPYRVTSKSSLIFRLLGGVAYELDEKRNEAGVVTEPGFFKDDGITHGTLSVKYLWQVAPWLKLETGIEYFRAIDDALYDGVLIDRDQTVWKSSVTISLP